MSIRVADPVPRLQITNVEVTAADPGWASWLDAPVAGDETAGWALTVSGWTMGPTEVGRIEIVHGCDVLGVARRFHRPDLAIDPALEMRAGETDRGFCAEVSLLGLPAEFELHVVLHTAAGEPLTIGRVRGRRTRATVEPTPRMTPIAVTCLGRSGTTLTQTLLALHPDVVVAPMGAYEARCVTYWMHMARVLSGPAAPMAPKDWIPYFSNPEVVRSHLFGPANFTNGDQVTEWLSGDYATRVVAFCRDSLLAFYEMLARAEGNAEARAFAEKQYPALPADVLGELIPGTRELFCVRDPRDVLVSVRAFAARDGHNVLTHTAAENLESLTRGLRADFAALVAAYRRRGDSSFLLRYEDLARRPHDVARAMFEHVGVEAGTATVDRCVAGAFADTELAREHRTTTIDRSVGRWLSELSASELEYVESLLKAAMDEFGYL